jgi:hypothetical protein
MNHGEVMVVLIVAIVMIASIFRARYGYGRRHRGGNDAFPPQEQAETLRLRDEVKELKERIKVLERITVEKENSLSRQIEELRDR